MTSRQTAITAFVIGLPPLTVAPFAVICGFHYALEAVGILSQPTAVPFDWGFGGLLYCVGLPVWLGYVWAASNSRTRAQLRIFWGISAGLNAIWVAFFFITLMRREALSSPASIWLVYALFPAALLALSSKGFNAAGSRHDQ